MSGNRTRGVCVTGRNVTNYTNTDLSLFQNLKRCIRSPMFESQRVRCCNRDSGSSFDHTMVDTPHPIRTAKLSTIGPDQYCGGGQRGNLGCWMFFFFMIQIINLFIVFLLRQCTALRSESTAPQTEITLGIPIFQKERICGKNMINLLIFLVFLTFWRICRQTCGNSSF